MANIKSALKRARQNPVRRERNTQYRSFMRSRVRAVRDAVAGGDVTLANKALTEAMGALHKVAAKGIIHSKTADRKIARLNAAVRAMAK